MRRIFSVGMVLMMLACQSAWGGWRDLLDSVLGEGNSEQVKEVAAAALGNDEIAAALKEALVQGTSKAVTALGTPGRVSGRPGGTHPGSRVSGADRARVTCIGQGPVCRRSL